MKACLGRLLRGPFEAAICFAAVVAFLAYLLNPHPFELAAIGHTARGLLPFWEVMYGTAGVLVLAGMLADSVRMEIAGLCVLVAALLINAIAIVNFSNTTGVISAATFAALAIAGVSRATFLARAVKRSRNGASLDHSS